MTARDFYDSVEGHDDLEYLGVADEEVLVRAPRASAGLGLTWALSGSTILAHTWREFEEVLTGRRDPTVMHHYSRVVGYYSRISNWNRSKIGELRDRHRGEYALEGEIDLPPQALPEELLEDLARAAGAGDSRLVCGIGEGPKVE